METFSDFVILTVTTGKRYEMLRNVMLTAIMGITHCSWYIVDQSGQFPMEDFKDVFRIASLRNVVVAVYPGNPNSSVAKEKIDFIESYGFTGKMILMVDDDVMIPAETFRKFNESYEKYSHAVLLTVSQFDIYPTRGHLDWDDKYYLESEYQKFCGEIGAEHTATHLWFADKNTNKGLGVRGAGVFSVYYNILVNERALCDRLRNWPKGERGYDVFLHSYLQAIYHYRCHFIFGANTYHIGLETPFYNSEWKTMNEEIV